MDHFVERQNVEHYNRLLELETDPLKRAMLLKLLAEEKTKQASHFEPKK
jgi:hypothetical protein